MARIAGLIKIAVTLDQARRAAHALQLIKIKDYLRKQLRDRIPIMRWGRGNAGTTPSGYIKQPRGGSSGSPPPWMRGKDSFGQQLIAEYPGTILSKNPTAQAWHNVMADNHELSEIRALRNAMRMGGGEPYFPNSHYAPSVIISELNMLKNMKADAKTKDLIRRVYTDNHAAALDGRLMEWGLLENMLRRRNVGSFASLIPDKNYMVINNPDLQAVADVGRSSVPGLVPINPFTNRDSLLYQIRLNRHHKRWMDRLWREAQMRAVEQHGFLP